MYTVTVGAGLAPAQVTSTCAATLRHPGGYTTRPYSGSTIHGRTSNITEDLRKAHRSSEKSSSKFCVKLSEDLRKAQ